MLTPNSPWPPHIGAPVSIKGSKLVGTVVNIQESGEGQIFVLHVEPPTRSDGTLSFVLARAAYAARTAYRLEELEQTTLP